MLVCMLHSPCNVITQCIAWSFLLPEAVPTPVPPTPTPTESTPRPVTGNFSQSHMLLDEF